MDSHLTICCASLLFGCNRYILVFVVGYFIIPWPISRLFGISAMELLWWGKCTIVSERKPRWKRSSPCMETQQRNINNLLILMCILGAKIQFGSLGQENITLENNGYILRLNPNDSRSLDYLHLFEFNSMFSFYNALSNST